MVAIVTERTPLADYIVEQVLAWTPGKSKGCGRTKKASNRLFENQPKTRTRTGLHGR